MGDYISLIILGVVQGLTEFLPISSTGHLILAREWFGFGGSFGLAEDAVLHLATAAAVLIYFWRDIWSFDRKTILALVAGTVPAVIIGLLFESQIETVLRGSAVVAGGLILGSLIFLAAEHIGKRIVDKKEVSIKNGLLIGCMQALALIPGMSRSGMTISGGLLLGLSRAEAARFGFLLSFPIILGAGGMKLVELTQAGALATIGLPLLSGAAAAFLSGLLAIHFLISFLKTHSLMPFIVYRLALAAVILTITFW